MTNDSTPAHDFTAFKAAQRELWAGFAANEGFTTIPAGELVAFNMEGNLLRQDFLMSTATKL